VNHLIETTRDDPTLEPGLVSKPAFLGKDQFTLFYEAKQKEQCRR
jgi:hypothetical protein